MRHRHWVETLFVVAGLNASPSVAGDLLPLKHGTYAEVNVPCADVSEATGINYFGYDLKVPGPTTDDTALIRKRGSVYVLSDTRSEPDYGKQSTVTMVVSVTGPTDFTIGHGKDAVSYRWCSGDAYP